MSVSTVLAAGCSAGSSGGAAPTPTPTGSRVTVNRTAVTSALRTVLAGLAATTSISSSDGIDRAAASLQRASDDLAAAGNALNPSPSGVPATLSLTVSTGLLRISDRLHASATCLASEAKAASPSTKPCVKPLRQANAKTGSLSRALVSLAAFGTESPKTFESDLVHALHGT